MPRGTVGSQDESERTPESGPDGDSTDKILTKLRDTQQWSLAVVSGAVVYLLGYALTGVLILADPDADGGDLTLVDQISRIGVRYNAAHGIDISASDPMILYESAGEFTELGATFDLFSFAGQIGQESTIPTAVFDAVPILVLLAVGVVFVWKTGDSGANELAVITTLGIAIGYGAVTYLSTLVFEYPIGELETLDELALVRLTGDPLAVPSDVEMGETVVSFGSESTGALFAGLWYPVVFSLIGALGVLVVRRYHLTDG